jgi:hypothetical protein
LVSIVAISASCGTCRKSRSNAQVTADRPFVEAVHLRQVVGGDARVAAERARGGFDFLDDARAAFVGIDQHVRAAQGVDVIASPA